MSTLRQQIAHETARKLRAAAASIAALKVLVGWDGFIDEIISVVDRRHDFERFEPIRTIDALGRRISAAAGQSTNLELVVRQAKLGGNGPILAGALIACGARLTYIGALGDPQLEPVFEPFAAAAERVISISQPGQTAALEFDDGKIMLGKQTCLVDVCWQRLIERVSPRELVELFDASAWVGMVNWSELPHMSDIWRHLADEVLPHLTSRRPVLVDLADPEKRTAADLAAALELLGRFGQWVDVTLGMNLKEARHVAELLAIEPAADSDAERERLAAAIRRQVGLACVAIHPRGGASAATAGGTASFAGPFIRQPMLSTGAGDHFNAGFALGQLVSLELAECLCAGVAASGYYVRTGQSATLAELADFIAALPQPEND